MKPQKLFFGLCFYFYALSPIPAQIEYVFFNQATVVDSTAFYTHCEIRETLNDSTTFVKRFRRDRALEFEGAYLHYGTNEQLQTGWFKYYKTQAFKTYLHYTSQFVNGKMHGERITYYPDGKIKRKEQWKYGEFVGGKCYSPKGKKKKFTPLFVAPQFPGGELAMLKYLSNRVNYPVLARENNIEGSAIISFVITPSGTVTTGQIERDPGAGCGAEALRVVQAMPDWKPGILDDEPISVRFTLPVRFKLE